MKPSTYFNLLTSVSMAFIFISCSLFPISTIVPIETTASPDINSQTIGYTPTKSSKTIVIPSPTNTIHPTYTKDGAEKILLGYFSNNGWCRLPCFWNLTPNESTYIDANNVLFPFTGISSLNSFEIDNITIRPELIMDGVNLELFIVFLFNNNVVSAISINSRAYRELTGPGEFELIYGSPAFKEILNYYLISNIMLEYGKPSTIMITTEGSINNELTIDALLLYPEKGILLNYQTKKQISGSDILGCFGDSRIEIILLPEGDGEFFMEFISHNWKDRLPNYKYLNEVTSMDVDGFYNALLNNPNECVSTPSRYWPIYSH